MEENNISEKSRLAAFILCFLLGGLGIHRMYVGKTGSGIAQLFFGFCTLFIWNLVDLIKIVSGTFQDKDGKVLKKWSD